MRQSLRSFALSAIAALTLASASAAPMLQVNPSTFDFGWAPDNSKITAEFTVVNSGEEMVPLTALKPACGCTATNFQPDALASREERKISLTFNTRGYTNQPFNKPAELKTDVAENKYMVYIKGHVLKPDNGLVPDSDGVAGFTKESDRKKKINITNKTAVNVTLAVVQAPASWASVKLPKSAIKPGESAELDISVDGSLEEDRNTSITLAPADDLANNRVTLAIRTGTPPLGYRIAPTAPKSPAAASPAGAGKPASGGKPDAAKTPAAKPAATPKK